MHTPAPQGTEPAAAHTPATHVCPASQQVVPHTVLSAAQQMLPVAQTCPAVHTLVPQGMLPGARHLFWLHTLGAWQHLPPQTGVFVGQQFQPSKQR